MRWAALFDDLEAQAQLLDAVERAAEVEDRARGEVGALGLWERARAAVGTTLRVRLPGAGTVTGTLERGGPEWWLLAEDAGREVVVVTARVVSVRGLGRYSAAPGGGSVVESRLGLRHVLRGIARDRSAVRIQLTDGSAADGTLDRVGADFVELASHPAGEARRARDVRDVELLPLAALVAVRRSV